MLDVDPWLAPLKENPEAQKITRQMETAIETARQSFVEAGGPALLGVE
jgi:hypothetical protein